jgi:hypothetical protein
MRVARPRASTALSALEQGSLDAALVREAQGDKARLKRLGAVHTPLPLVHFALTRLEHALRHDFALSGGLSSARLQLLDPALGTGIWLSALLTRLSGPELPHAVLGFDADADAHATARALLIPAARARGIRLELAHENTLALASPWLSGDQVRVVLGNPPWGARSLSRGVSLNDAWLREFHRDHEGQPLGERRTGVLSDDYVRFFRWALEQARQAPQGALVCFVTNASYLDGPVHRGMRAALCQAFDRIETFALGGGSLRSRAAGADEPLFPVRVAAALSVCVRRAVRGPRAFVSYRCLSGTRSEKLAQLEKDGHGAPAFTPAPPWFRFVPEAHGAPASVQGFALHEAFVFHAEGVQTNRDAVVTSREHAALCERLTQIASGKLALPKSPHFDPERVRRRLESELAGDAAALIGELAYRPLETRFYCRLAPLCHRPRPLLERAVQASELCLFSTRKEPGALAWNMFALGTRMADSSFLSTRSACRTRVFPSHDAEGRENLSPHVVDGCALRIGRAPSARELVLYIAGVLGAPSYRSAHAAWLKLDYPRLPWPSTAAAFAATVSAGALFLRALEGQPVGQRTLSMRTRRAASERVSLGDLRWLSPHQLEVCSGTEIGAGNARPFRAAVGHHDLVARAFARDGRASIAEVHETCERAAMWVEAERAADEAYQPASSVGRAANVIAAGD